ncbi:lantibiotic dehydratase [uncultured Chryseobacterium sp.]|uniref:lantibiotic dehydratase n=1 Tax=uncultured Chryseobacterium sp. TaxID=259322 RepID=UPI0025D1820D|nr:lantibiotic dehydratase [uncultured Chryseobacterium sp.]
MENNKYFLLDHCCLRIPSHSIDAFLDFNENIKNISLENHEELVQVLNHIFSNTYYKEAVYIASKDLYETFLELKENNFANKDAAKRFLMTFYKYFSRMSNRSTPYGLFSGTYSAGIIDQPTNIKFDNNRYRLVCQLNIHTLTKLIRSIDPLNNELINKIKYYKNNTLYTLGNKAYFVEQFDNGRYIASNLTSIRLSEYVKIILQCAEQGATVVEMADKISNPAITLEQKQNFIKNIIQSQILVSQLLPSVSTENFIEDLINTIDEKEINIEEINELKEINHIIRNMSSVDDIDLFRTYIKNNSGSSIISRDFYKLDLFYNLQKGNLNRKILNEINDISYEVMHLFSQRTSLALSHFVNAFASRYEDRELPLVQVLDTNYGIGYEKVVSGNAEYTPLLDGIPVMSDSRSEARIIYGGFEMMRDKIFKQYCKTGDTVIYADEDFKNYLSQKPQLSREGEAPSAYIFGRILSPSAEALDNGDYKFFPTQCHAPFAARLLTRFTHGNNQLKNQVKKIADFEQKANPDVIMAEVLTIPDDNYANITLYSTIRDYEIPFLSNSKLSKDHQIHADDLLVSVRNGKVVLRSKKLNKEIIPCLSNTYNTTLAQPLYKFLADVGSQNMRLGYFWDWGIYQNEPFLPRIEYKKIIISRARWFMKKIKTDYRNEQAAEAAIADLKIQYNLPQYVVLSSGDNELLIDLDNKIGQAILLKEISQQNVIVYENIHNKENCFIKEGDNSYANEVVIPLLNKMTVYLPSVLQHVSTPKIKRIFPPGSEWFYIKIYSGSKNVEDILTEVISDFAVDLLNKKIIDKWFFIKYNDPDHHIRVRFHCFNPDKKKEEWYLISENLQKAIHEFIPEEQALRITIDTYIRELERYGDHTMELSENIFYYDSTAVSEFLNLIHGNEGEKLRWKFALVNVDKLLNDFKYSVKDKIKVIGTLCENFTNEFSFNNADNYVALSRTLSTRHRELKREISDIIFEKDKAEYHEAYECFNKRSENIATELSRYPELPQETKDHLIMSYIHMTLNRLFMVNQRRHELVIYYFLKKFYESEIAKAKNNISI